MDTLAALRTFVRIVETGTFSAVAREIKTSQSVVTRQVAQLEEHFGVRLFHRTTRHLSVTEDGQDLLGHARRLLELSDGMEAALNQRQVSPVGHVRLGTSVGLGMLLAPRMPAFFQRYPGLSVELIMRDHFGDMIEERLDLVTRPYEVNDSSLVARRLGMYRRMLVAAPRYLDAHPAPTHPRELGQHDCIVHDNGQSNPSEWHLSGADGMHHIIVSGTFSSDNSEAVRRAVVAGAGIGMLPDTQVIDDIRAGNMCCVLCNYPTERKPAYIVYPSRRHLPPRTRVVIDFVVQQVRSLEVLLDDFYGSAVPDVEELAVSGPPAE